jgi:hypothetical protein
VNQSSFHKTGDTPHPKTAAARHSFQPSIGKADVPLACPSQHQPHKNLPMFVPLECDAVEIAEGFLLIVGTLIRLKSRMPEQTWLNGNFLSALRLMLRFRGTVARISHSPKPKRPTIPAGSFCHVQKAGMRH